MPRGLTGNEAAPQVIEELVPVWGLRTDIRQPGAARRNHWLPSARLTRQAICKTARPIVVSLPHA